MIGQLPEWSAQYPLPADADGVYLKDLSINELNEGTFTGEDITSLFNALDTSITDTTTTNPKYFEIKLNRSYTLSGVAIIANTGDFSNVKIIFKDRQGTVLKTFDDSADSTKHTSNGYPVTAGNVCCILVEFHTADPVTVSFLRIPKEQHVVARMKALRPDGTIAEIGATQGGNLKVAIEEFDAALETDPLPVKPIVVDEYGTQFRLLGDNIFHGAPIVISPEHHEIHCGDSYEATDIFDIPNGATRDYLVVVPNEAGTGQDQKLYHVKFKIDTEAEATIRAYEGTTVSSNGTALTSFNRNRNSTNTDTLGVYYGPTVTTTGPQLYVTKLGSGKAVGGSAERADEFVVRNNETYLIRITNDTTSPNYLSFEIDYYVHPGI